MRGRPEVRILRPLLATVVMLVLICTAMTIAIAFGCTGGGIIMMPTTEMFVTVSATLLSGILSGLVSAKATDALG